ncbi:MAG: DUF3305 domain-containing protein [Caldimonas sp.]
MNATNRSGPRPVLSVAVVMDRERAPNQWQDWRFTIAEVVASEEAFGSEPRVLRDDGRVRRTLYPGFTLELHVDQGEGYYLNLSSGAPVWFVVWRIDDDDPSRAWPETVSVSYNEAGRWLDAQERVDNVPLQADLVAWLQAYTDEHYRPEAKRVRNRPQSFVAPAERK